MSHQLGNAGKKKTLCGYSAGMVLCPMRLCGTGTSSNKEDDYRAAYPSWMDKVASDIRTQ